MGTFKEVIAPSRKVDGVVGFVMSVMSAKPSGGVRGGVVAGGRGQ